MKELMPQNDSSDPDPDPENAMDFVYTEDTSASGSIASSVAIADTPAAGRNSDVLPETEPTPPQVTVSPARSVQQKPSSIPQIAENEEREPEPEPEPEHEPEPEPVSKVTFLPAAVAKRSSEIIAMSAERTRNPTPASKLSVPLRGPGLMAVVAVPETNTTADTSSICPRCGLKIDAADTKMIPKERVWFCFMLLFFCLCWWISWLPFLCKRWYKPAEICPHCYRRIDRPHVGSDSVNAHLA